MMMSIQMERSRLEQIERENRKLLKRMSEIMTSHGRIDNGYTSKGLVLLQTFCQGTSIALQKFLYFNDLFFPFFTCFSDSNFIS